MIWDTNAVLVSLVVVLRAIRSFSPLLLLLITRQILDCVVGLVMRHTGDPVHLRNLLLLEFAVASAASILTRATNLTATVLGDRFNHSLSIRLMEHALTLDLAAFEDAHFHDILDRARRESAGRLKLLGSVMGMFQDTLSLISLSISLIAFWPWLAVFLVMSVIPTFLGEGHFAALSYEVIYRRTPERRRLDYLRFLCAGAQSVKEVKVFGLGPHLVSRYSRQAKELEKESEALALRAGVWGSALNVLSTAGHYACYAAVVFRGIAAGVTVGTFCLLMSAFARASNYLERILSRLNDLTEETMLLEDLFEFFDFRPSLSAPAAVHCVPRPVRLGFEFRNVSFAYPGASKPALSNVSFRIHPGERIALIGENGAGKTTVVKLLTRLYEPTGGSILLDGLDLREYDLSDLRNEIGVVFQDYMRYEMSAGDNIGFGNVEMYDDRRALEEAARKSGALRLIARLPGGLDQMIGKRFEGGVDLSGGEWQRLGLARGYMRDAQLLILDEPTAALDVNAEHQMFLQFSERTRGRMAVLISHRFSTVRMADRILVFGGGQIQEEGSHQSLMALGGRYSSMFEMQAAAYR